MRLLLSAAIVFGAAVASTAASVAPISDAAITGVANPSSLSAFGFFDGGPDKPSSRLIPYSLHTPLFSDYAAKQRFIYLPAGAKPTVDADGKLQFPVGSALIKSFGYPRNDGALNVLETRLLLRRADGWVALPYVWRADHSDADLRVGGTRIPVSFRTPSGNSMQISYAVPNKNQCKQCHSSHGAIMPIGPVAQNLVFPRTGDKKAILGNLAVNAETAWDDLKAPVSARASAYLRVNCGHCHSPGGSASNSGLFFDKPMTDPAHYGIGKRPVAAGRGSGDDNFVIEPGHPERSILIYRMKSTDPGIAMPELGRSTVHEEGVALLEKWISGLSAN